VRRFELVEGKSSKFWEVAVEAAHHGLRAVPATWPARAREAGTACAQVGLDRMGRQAAEVAGAVEAGRAGGGWERAATAWLDAAIVALVTAEAS
jgi:hypothetical protein